MLPLTCELRLYKCKADVIKQVIKTNIYEHQGSFESTAKLKLYFTYKLKL